MAQRKEPYYENMQDPDATQEYVISRETLNNNSPRTRRATKCDANEQSFPLFHTVCEKCEELSDKITDFVPAWDLVVGRMQDLSGMRKKYILTLLVSAY